MENRRIAIVPVAWHLIEEALFPPGTIIRDATFNFVRMTVDFVVEHPHLAEVPPGALPPTETPVATTESVEVRREITW